MRIASLLPSATEIVCSLGLENELVAITHECDYPESVRGKPVLTRTARFGYGRHAFAFRPCQRGGLEVRLRAVDLAGNVGAIAGRIAVRAR